VTRALAIALAAWVTSLVGCTEPEARSEATRSAAPGACGAKGQPDCPLQRWMKANAQANLASGDTTRLADAMETLARGAPEGFPGWAESARNAAESARAKDLDAVRAQCRECHAAHRARYRATHRTAPAPGAQALSR